MLLDWLKQSKCEEVSVDFLGIKSINVSADSGNEGKWMDLWHTVNNTHKNIKPWVKVFSSLSDVTSHWHLGPSQVFFCFIKLNLKSLNVWLKSDSSLSHDVLFSHHVTLKPTIYLFCKSPAHRCIPVFYLMSSTLCPPATVSVSLPLFLPASNTGRRARGAKQRLNLVSEPRLILYSFPLKEHESCSLPVVAAVPPSIRKTNGRRVSVST